MKSRTVPIILLTAVPALAMSLPTPARPGSAPSSVKSQIAADIPALDIAKPFTIAVTLTTNPLWHLYWSNPGDSGYATTFHWQLPEGFQVQLYPLPLPVSFTQPGNLTAYGYTGKTTFLFKITPGPGTFVTVGSPVTFSVTAKWLCCNKDQCVPGQAKLDLQLPIITPSTTHAFAAIDKSLFTAARQNLPAAAIPKEISLSAKPAILDDAKNATAILDLAFKSAPISVEAFPDADEGLAVTSIKVDQTKDHAKISLTAHHMAGQQLQFVYLPLLIVYTLPDPDKKGEQMRRGFFVPVDLTLLGAKPDSK